MNSKRKLKSYVWHGEQCFFVSTIERDSSACVTPAPRYHETIAWVYDWDGAETVGDMIWMEGEGECFAQHQHICEQLFRTGEVVDDGEN